MPHTREKDSGKNALVQKEEENAKSVAIVTSYM